MSDARSGLPPLVIIDSRSPAEPPLRTILGRATARHEVRLAASLESAVAAISAEPAVAVLMHASFGHAPGALPVGPFLAEIARGRDADRPFLLYAGTPRAHGRKAVQLGSRLPFVSDDRLTSLFDPILADLLAHSSGNAALRRALTEAPDEPMPPLPDGFLIERWLGQVERAILIASLREHKGGPDAAVAVGMTLTTFFRRVRQHGLKLPNRDDWFRDTADTLPWCSPSPVPAWVGDACAGARVKPKPVPPGGLHVRSLQSTVMLAGIVQPTCAGGVVDAWLLSRSTRPHVIVGSAPAPVRFLMGLLHATGRILPSPAIVGDLARAGRAAVGLYADEDLDALHGLGPDGSAAWPLDLPGLLRELDGQILRFADETHPTAAAAARAVGLSLSTYRSRLRRAERRR